MDFDSLPDVPSAAELGVTGTTGEYVKDNEWLLAFHESAHIVAEIVLNSTIPDLVYLNDGYREGVDDHSARTQGDRQFPDPKVYAGVAAAGVLGPLLALEIEPNTYELADVAMESTGRDEIEIFHFAPQPIDDPFAWAESAYTAAAQCLRSHWPAVELMARSLVQRRTLNAEDLRSIWTCHNEGRQ